MQKIRNYTDRFFKGKPENENYSLTMRDLMAFFKEIQSPDGDDLFHTIVSIFKYGYVKGYRACKAEQKKARKAV